MHMGNMNSGGLYLKRNLNGIHCMHLGFNALDTYMQTWPFIPMGQAKWSEGKGTVAKRIENIQPSSILCR